MLVSKRRQLDRPRVLRLLDELEASSGPAVTLYVSPGTATADIEQRLQATTAPEDVTPDLAGAAARSTTGAVVFWGEQHRRLVLPPFPLEAGPLFNGYQVDPLRQLLRSDLTIALVLVRLGAFAVGLFQGDRLVSSKVGKGLVHARHGKGGSSQRRFERHREKQIEGFFTRLCDHARERLEPYLRETDYVLYGGERSTVLALQKQCRFLNLASDRTLQRLLNVREPRQSTLEDAIGEAWSSQLTEWSSLERASLAG